MNISYPTIVHNFRGPFALCLGILFIFSLPTTGRASAWSQKVRMEDGKKVAIEVSSMIDVLPPTGYFPLRIHIKNDRDEGGRWLFVFKSTGTYDESTPMSYSQVFQVGPREERRFELMAPIHPSHAGRHIYPRFMIDVSGPEARPDSRVRHSSSYRSAVGTFAGISTKLANRNIGALENSTSTQAVAVIFTRMALESFADDIRAYSAFDIMLMEHDEWQSLGHQPRYIIKQWIALGGTLMLFAPNPSATAIPADLENGVGEWPQSWKYGWGRVQLFPMTERQVINAEEVIKSMAALPSLNNLAQSSYSNVNWPMRRNIPEIRQPRALLLISSFAVAFIIGPINLFVAHRRKRHIQLLWTTPALSMLAGLLIAIFIMFSDGFGGYGQRLVVSHLLSHDQLEVTVQEQVSRTGVLLSRRFNLPSHTMLNSVQADNSKGIKPQFKLNIEGVANGSWFTSRAIQGQVFRKATPSRARVEIWTNSNNEESEPEIFSAIGDTLKKIYVVDAEGRHWMAENIHAGESKKLKAIPPAEFRNWWRELRDAGGGLLRMNVGGSESMVAMFYAEVARPESRLLPSLRSVRWTKDRAFVMGPLMEMAQP
ncbi:MAG TPA: hypothetical protein PJ991_02900 [Kiritimatiellia bacterium]|nr:hypothetical protein [Kiritimatiellia bacterium]